MDGFVQLMPLERHMWNGLVNLMGNPPWSQEEKYDYANIDGRPVAGISAGASFSTHTQIQQEVNDYLEVWALEHNKQEIYYEGQEHGVAVGMVATPGDLFQSQQLQARGFFTELEHPRAGKLGYPGAPFKLSQSPQHMKRAAPLLGEHNEEVFLNLGFSREDLIRLREEGVV